MALILYFRSSFRPYGLAVTGWERLLAETIVAMARSDREGLAVTENKRPIGVFIKAPVVLQ